MPTGLAQSESTSGVCKNCGHKARNHFSDNSPIRGRCLERDCKCNWTWNGENDTNAPLSEAMETSHPLIAHSSHRLDLVAKDSSNGGIIGTAQKG